MDLIKVMERFPDQESCIAHLEKMRWKGKPKCPHCESTHVGRRTETEEGRIGRWNCHDCHVTFKATCGTVFHGTKIALQKWFLAIALIANAKKSLSSHQLARDLSLNQKTSWYILTRIRAEMAKKAVCSLRVSLRLTKPISVGSPARKINVPMMNPLSADVAQRKTLSSGLSSEVERSSHNSHRI